MEITKNILDKIKEYDKIMIHRHQSPDPDALGSQGGLALLLKESFPEKEIFVVGGPVGGLDYLLTMDEVEDEMYQGALVITTDTANEPRVSGKQYKLGDLLIKIDHHPDDEPYGDISWVNPKASSTSEMIYDFFEAHKDELVMPTEAAKLLYAGIIGDTGRFMYPATTSHTLWVASQLMTYPFDAANLNRTMDEVSEKIARLAGYVAENIEVDENGAAMVLLPQEVLDKFEIEDSETPPIIPIPGKIKGIKAWGIFVAQPEGFYRVRLRSKGPVINTIAKRHHGGGHPLASGANAKDLDEVKEIYQEIQQAVKDNK
ncbi:bifunctional oligoribonuclease/PAP phosphatase NrnA [Vagococcus carniphilus]|uniref:DHH family phosphoesterase n=1 Tax=Vagococcus carniphilus TaxID=218144 RepID=UPI00288F2E65|nr:bifunctional oligoribonuclease/PAP phosphatase NrnA [Vagococcus carniphilus]MDT2813533.1 bifunctional oligoribonuclease/PAP phosphatase NrnA [Vagococcus carniphilus]MDT2829964.1 bifunctional oligoribonuclease/PAP phosphatase NrnA [Vagococcus carniphilus]MDT2838399.1 bifunctional oligoribonuclease/PAP phosphatase NrnA [Vagococcus carniphilus]MDT2850148.1 bifunctional oligoribonuclease/PAP phosphatase NrnA [Vagococcus carniphilus]MDT2854395.1 bifunctional oligoribonuclease/PAP phosphatase Nrn